MLAGFRFAFELRQITSVVRHGLQTRGLSLLKLEFALLDPDRPQPVRIRLSSQPSALILRGP
jgi:hypothetical protein